MIWTEDKWIWRKWILIDESMINKLNGKQTASKQLIFHLEARSPELVAIPTRSVVHRTPVGTPFLLRPNSSNSWSCPYFSSRVSLAGWWLGHPSEKYESQLGWLFPLYGKIKNGNQTTNQLDFRFWESKNVLFHKFVGHRKWILYALQHLQQGLQYFRVAEILLSSLCLVNEEGDHSL